MRSLGAGLRFAVGTLTVLPVRATGAPGRQTAAAAMVWAPAVGVFLATIGAGVALVAQAAGAASGLAAVLAVATLAAATRGLHLDGLADTVDGLGSGRSAAGALAVLRAGDIGPFGVLVLTLVLLAQVAALTAAFEAGRGAAALVVAAAAGRATLALGCRRGVPAARKEGLGAAVAGTVGPGGLVTAVAGVVLLAAGTGLADPHPGLGVARAVLAVAVALVIAAWLLRTAVRRLGGITGDVLGALVEAGSTGALIVLSLG